MNLIFLKDIKVHPEWKEFLDSETIKLLSVIEKKITGTRFTPPPEKILRFLEMPLSKIKVVILGQDPYPQPGAATGRAFEVGTLNSWNEPFRNISLKNILRSLYQAYTGSTIKFNDLKQKLDNEFPVLPPNKLFNHWELQGVLLLNTSFTCETENPGSHKDLWKDFTYNVIDFLEKNTKQITWFLWGNHAEQAAENHDLNKTCRTQHPMMCYDKPGRNKDFLYGELNCFAEFIPEIDWTGYDLSKNFKTTQKLF